MTAYEDLYGYTTISNLICQKCCDIMYYLSDIFNMSYEAFNYLCLYIIQPSIYIGIMIIELLYLCKYNKYWILSVVIPIFYIKYITILYNNNWHLLGLEKIKNLFNLSQKVGLSYSELNIYQFIICFLLTCISYMTFILCNNYTYKKIIYVIYFILSPYLIFVLYT